MLLRLGLATKCRGSKSAATPDELSWVGAGSAYSAACTGWSGGDSAPSLPYHRPCGFPASGVEARCLIAPISDAGRKSCRRGVVAECLVQCGVVWRPEATAPCMNSLSSCTCRWSRRTPPFSINCRTGAYFSLRSSNVGIIPPRDVAPTFANIRRPL
jgi:hypothetical protein